LARRLPNSLQPKVRRWRETYSASPSKADEVVRAIQAAGGKALAVRADAGDVDAVKAAVARTVQAFGRLDILVNNAGLAVIKPVNDIMLEDLDRIFAVNVKGLFVATQEAVRHMGEGGRIINIGSINSDYVPYSGGSLYVMTRPLSRG
jgi:3-oxoacyl-[acyl-carrier protein] reductase